MTALQPDRRRTGFWADAQRTANTVFLFYFNPILDPETNRISGTRLLAWLVAGINSMDVLESHRLAELKLAKGPVDAIDAHTAWLYGLAFLIWNGPKGMAWGVDLVNAWKGRGEK